HIYYVSTSFLHLYILNIHRPPIPPLFPYTTLFRSIQFHSPFKTGYDLWVSYFSRHHLLFCLRYIPKNVLIFWREATLQPRGCKRSEEHTSELQSHLNLVCRLLLEKKNKHIHNYLSN